MPPEVVTAMKAQIPMKRLGEAIDIAEMVLYLASPVAAYVTGQVLGVNGGLN